MARPLNNSFDDAYKSLPGVVGWSTLVSGEEGGDQDEQVKENRKKGEVVKVQHIREGR